jgi:hypothetical protein
MAMKVLTYRVDSITSKTTLGPLRSVITTPKYDRIYEFRTWENTVKEYQVD